MKSFYDFMSASLPWICMGLLLAVFFAKNGGLTAGMLLGLAFGSCIEKKKNNGNE